jgi:hypothetical protein
MRHNFPSHFYEVVGLRSILFFFKGTSIDVPDTVKEIPSRFTDTKLVKMRVSDAH